MSARLLTGLGWSQHHCLTVKPDSTKRETNIYVRVFVEVCQRHSDYEVGRGIDDATGSKTGIVVGCYNERISRAIQNRHMKILPSPVNARGTSAVDVGAVNAG